ncbi:MAG: Calx-beta domain-containing protein, partial [Spirosomataceae bacterium]
MKFTFPFSVSILLSLFIGMLNRSDKTFTIPDETQQSSPYNSKAPALASVARPSPFLGQPNGPAAYLTQGTTALLAPAITATKTAVLVTDNGTAGATPTDVIEYTVTVNNTGPDDATGVVFTDTVDPNTTLVPGSVKSAPIAVKDAYSTVGNVSISVPAGSGLTSNDVNLDGDVLTVTAVDVTGTAGQVTFAANGSFTFNPNPGFTGPTTFTYTVSDGTFTSTGTVTVTMTGMIWFINASASAGGDGRLGSPFNTMNAFNGSSLDDPGDNIFVYTGTYTNTLATILLDQQKLIGQGAVGTDLAALAGVTFSTHPPISPATIPTVNGTRPIINQAANNINMQSRNQVRGVNINNTGGTALLGSNFTSALVRDANITNTGGVGLSFNNGALDMIIPKVDVSNSSTGIFLSQTTGSFEITGSGTTDASGGTLTNISGRGIEIRNATNITLRNMSLPSANSVSDAGFDTQCDEDDVNACFAAIYMNIVNTVALHNIDIGATKEHGIMGLSVSNLTMDNCTATNNGDAPSEDENALKFRNLSGTCSITNSTFQTSAVRIFHLINNTGSLNLTVNNCILNDPTGADCFEARTQGSATATINLTNSRFQRAGSKGIQVIAEGSSNLTVNINNCKVERFGNPMAGIEVGSVGTATINYNIVNCTDIEAANEVAVLSSTFNTSTLNGRLNNNTNITHNHTAATIFSTIRMLHEQNSSAKYEIRNNNNIGLINGDATIQGISRVATTSAGRLDFFVDDNNLTRDAASSEGIEIRLGTGGADDETNIFCSDVLANSVTGPSGTRAIRVRDLEPTAGDLRLQGDNGPDVPTYWADRGNTNSAGMLQTETGTPTYFVSTATCLTPGHPTARIAAEPLAIYEPKTEMVEVAQIIEEPKQEVENQTATPSTEEIQKAAEEAARRAVVLSGETVTVGGIGGFLLPAGQNIIIKFRVTINDPLPAGVCQISNQGSVNGSNFSTLQTDDVAGNPVSPTVTQLSKHSLGNLVYRDNNKNGTFDGGDVGIDGVTVNLYLDNGNGVLDIGDGASVATTTTAGGGLYTFSNLCSGDYIVQIPASEFGSGQELNGLISSPGGPAPDPDNNTNNDDNGQDAINSSIASQAITLAYTGADVENNMTLDFGFRTPTTVTITDVTMNEGTGSGPTAFTFTVNRSDTDQAFSLTVNTNAGTATSGTDYTSITNGSVVFTAGGNSSETVTVNVTHDNIVEANETFTVLLSNPPDGVIISDGSGTGTITNDDAAVVTLTGTASQNEGTSFTFTATLNNPVQGSFTVPYTTNNGVTNPATAGTDYTDNDGTLSFAGTAGETKTITVNTAPDNTVELDETFTVALGTISGAPAGVTVAGSPQTGTITNDDVAIVALAGSVSQSEATTPQVFSVTLSNPVDVNVTVQFSTTNGTATTADLDYTGIGGQTVTFTAGTTTTQTVNVSIGSDNKVEADEVFNVSIGTLNASGRNVSFGPTAATGTILNDDAATVTLSAAATPLQHPEGNSGTTDFVFTATLNNPVQGGFTLAYTTSDGLATLADNDYLDNDGSLNFTGTANEVKTITVQVNGDLKVEANEDFVVALGAVSSAPAGVTANTAPLQGLIVNDELDWGDAPASYGTLSANNGARHNTSLIFHLGATVDGDQDGQPTAIGDGDDIDAEGDDDDGVTLPSALITGTTASVTVNASGAGFLNAWVDFNNNGNWSDMGEQIFSNVAVVTGNNPFTFAVPAGATPSTTFARFRYTTASVGSPSPLGLQTTGEVEDYQVNILDNQYAISSPTVTEGASPNTVTLTFAVSRTNGTGTGSVNYSAPTGTATSGTDYTALAAGTVNFANGETSHNLVVSVNGDNVVEDNETVIITLSNPVNGGIGSSGVGTGTITNDDQAGLTLSGGVAQNETNSGSVAYTFTATLSAPVQDGFTIAYTTGGGTATAGTDYTDNDGSLAFTGNAGETKTWTVNVAGDNTVELDETFLATLGSITMTSAVQAAAISLTNSPQTATITNDDAAVVSISSVSQSEATT